MAGPRIVKNLSSEYLIKGAGAVPANVIIGEDTRTDASLVVNGNLTVLGTQTTINSVNTDIADNIITLVAGLEANVAPSLNAGIEVNRGLQPNAAIRWNETLDKWEITDSSGVYQTIIYGNSTNFDLVNDLTPQLGGDLDVNGHTITSTADITLAATDNTKIESNLQLRENSPYVNVVATPGEITLSGGQPDAGDTGIYVTNSAVSNEELITKSKAVIYSIIF